MLFSSLFFNYEIYEISINSHNFKILIQGSKYYIPAPYFYNKKYIKSYPKKYLEHNFSVSPTYRKFIFLFFWLDLDVFDMYQAISNAYAYPIQTQYRHGAFWNIRAS